MPVCEHCKTPLPGDGIRFATCPVCGRIADPNAGDRTEEFDAPVAVAAAAAKTAESLTTSARTSRPSSTGPVRPAAPPAPKSGPPAASNWADQDAGMTFECEQLPAEIARTMNAIWLPAIDEHTAPNVTVKGAEILADGSVGRTLEWMLEAAAAEAAESTGDATWTDAGPPPPRSKDAPSLDKTVDGTLASIASGVSQGDRTLSEWRVSSDPGTIHSPSDETLSDLVIKQRNFRSMAEEEQPDNPDAEYELISILGEGGMGVVYAARQRSVNRSVAVKMLKRRGIDKSDQAIARQKFLAEAVVTGDLDHPNIVPIYDVGRNEHDALFYSMKRVHGAPWLEVLAAKSLPENLEILMKVADAVAFAHSRGVVHRDLKPENVMLGEFGEVQLMDWGLALPTARFDKGKKLVKMRGMGGTPAYMAPEMATGPLERIGPHSDIYLLGAILFEVVTGRRPHEGMNARECLISAARNQIVRSRKSGELMDIALKAMATRPKDRYATVQEFQAALRGYLSHSESIALSSQAEDDLRKAAKTDDYQDFSQALFGFKEALKLWDGNTKARDGLVIARLGYAESAYHKGDYELGVGLLDLNVPEHAVLHREIQEAMAERDARQQRLNTARRIGRFLIGLVFAIVVCAAVWINAERKEAVLAQEQAEDARRDAEVDREAAVTAQRQKEAETQRAVDALKREARSRREADAQRAIAEDARKAEAYEGYIARIGLAAAKIRENAFGTAQELLKQCGPQNPGDIDQRHWEWGRLMHLCSQSVHSINAEQPLYALAVAPDGQRFVAAGVGGIARIYDRQTRAAIAELRHNGDVYAVAYSPDGRFIATGSADRAGYVRVWAAATGELVRAYGSGGFATEHTGAVLSVAFSADGRWLLTGSQDETARLWDVATGAQIRRFWGHSGWVWAAAFCPNTTSVGRVSDPSEIGGSVSSAPGRAGSPSCAAEKRIVTASQDGTARIWRDQSASHQPPWTHVDGDDTFREHNGPVFAAAVSPDGKLVATAGYDHRVLLWEPDRIAPDQIRERVTEQPVRETRHRLFEGHTAAVRTLAFLGDGEHVLSGSDDNTVRLWNVTTGSSFKTFRDWSNAFRGHDSGVRGCAFEPGAGGVRWILSAGLDGTIKEWSIAGYEEIRELEGRVLAGAAGHAAAILSADFSADGKHVVTASQDRTARTWDAERGRLIHTFQEGHELLASSVVFFSDRRRIVTAAVDNTARVWDIGTGTELLRLDRTGRNAAVAVSRDQKWILTGSDRASYVSFRGSASERQRSQAEPGNESAGVWAARLWDAASGRLVREFAGHRNDVTAAAFSPDARLAVSGDASGRVCLWETETGRLVREIDGHARGGHITGVAFTPDGRYVLTASTDHTVATWDANTGSEVAERRMRHPEAIVSMALSPDGRQVLTSCEDRVVRLWDTQSATVIRVLETGAGLVNAVDIAPDGRRALTVNSMSLEGGLAPGSSRPGTNDLTVRLWDLTTGREITYPAGRSSTPSTNVTTGGPPVAPDITRQPTHAAAGGRNANPPDTRDRGPFLDFKQPALAGLVWSAAFSPDGEHVVTVGGSEARMWTTQVGEPGDLERPTRGRADFRGPIDREIVRFSPQAELAVAAFSPDGAWLVTGSWDGTARLWDRRTGRTLVKLTLPDGDGGRINSAAFAPRDRQQILTAGDDGTARLWRIAGRNGDSAPLTATVVRTFRPTDVPPARIHQAAFSPDGGWVLTASDDGRVRIWSVTDGRLVVGFEAHRAPVLCAAFSADGRRILTGSEDSTGRLWALARTGSEWTVEPVLTLRGHTARITSVAFSPVEDTNGNGLVDPGEEHSLRALTASADTTVKLWDTRVMGTRQSTENAPPALAEVAHLDQALPGAERRAGTAGDDIVGPNEPRGTGPGFAKEILTLSGHSQEVTSVRFSPDGRQILTAGRDGRAILWLTMDWREPAAEK